MTTDSLAASLTQQFYLWERRGRGWQVWDHAVGLEPPFARFSFRQPVKAQRDALDDGRKPTILSNIVDGFKRGFRPPSYEDQYDGDSVEDLIDEPLPFADGSPREILRFSLPAELNTSLDQTEHFLVSLSLTHSPVSFEIRATADRITFQIACSDLDVQYIESSFRAYYPGVTVERFRNDLMSLESNDALVIDFGLSEEFMRPLRLYQRLDPDPLTGLVAAMETLKASEQIIVQVLFQATRGAWTESVFRSVSDGTGGSFFEDAPEMLQLAREKTKRPLFASVVRLLVTTDGDNTERRWEIARQIAGAIISATADPVSNELIPLTNEGYDDAMHIDDVILRTSCRSGMILSTRELITLVHPPSSSLQSEKLSRIHKKTRGAPACVRGNPFVLGENTHRGERTPISLNVKQRLRHTYVIGATGTGKSTLLLSLIKQDIEQGRGLALIDPHGDLIDRVIDYVPRERFSDVVLIDPADSENHNGVNILAAESESEKNVATSDLVSVFKRLSASWGDQMTSVLGNAIQAFLESSRGGTLKDLQRFLLERDFRNDFLRSVEDDDVRYFWESQYPLFRGNTVASLLTRLDTFLRPKPVKKTVAPEVDLKFEKILNERKILLVKLAQGLIGGENTSLLGSLLVSKLHQAAMGRQTIKEEEREPFFLYIDEFQNFITPSLAGVLSGTRKYGLGLILAHQELRQIWNQDTGVANSLLSNPATRICFRVGDFDGQKLKDGFAHFDAQDLQNLSVGETIVRVDRADNDFTMQGLQPRPIDRSTGEARRDEILKRSRRVIKTVDVPMERVSQVTKEELRQEHSHARDAKPSRQKESSPRRTSEERIETRPTVPAESPAQAEEREEKKQHRYLQALIKRTAEEWGYRATIEEPTPDGKGRVDVGLSRKGQRVACEISVTTSDEHELQNIRKCLLAGYSTIILVAGKKRLNKLRPYFLKKANDEEKQVVQFLQPEDIPDYFERHASHQSSKEQTVKGYRVKVQYHDVRTTEGKEKRETVAQVVLQSMRRLRKDKNG